MGSERENTIDEELYSLWNRIVNSERMRALMEILFASRTDAVLKNRIKDNLVEWNDSFTEYARVNFASIDGDDDRFERIWTIARIFFRGLITHDAFVENEGDHRELVDEFINLIAPLLKQRNK